MQECCRCLFPSFEEGNRTPEESESFGPHPGRATLSRRERALFGSSAAKLRQLANVRHDLDRTKYLENLNGSSVGQ